MNEPQSPYSFAVLDRSLLDVRADRDERLRDFLEGAARCSCAKPLPARRYFGVWSCRKCELAIIPTGIA